MPEAIGTQHDEHVHFWSEPPQTLERLVTLLKNDDEYKTAFAESRERPERSQDDGEYHRKFRALVRTYLDAHVQKVRDSRRQQDTVDALSETHVAQPLVSAAREIMGLDGGDDIARITGDKRERLMQWIEGLLAPDHYSPAFQYLMWGTMLRKRKQEERIEAPLPPFHDSVIGAMEDLVTAYDRATSDGKSQAVRAVIAHDNLFAFARGAGFSDRLAKNILAYLNPKNGSIVKLHEELEALVTDVEYGEGEVVGQWITFTKGGIEEQWPAEMVQQFGARNLLKKGDGARMLQLISQNVPWCLNRYATASSYLERGKLLVFVTKSPKGWIPAFGIAFEQRGGEERIYEARGADDNQEINPRFAGVVATRREIQADPNYKKRIDDAQMLARMGRQLEKARAENTMPALTREQLAFLYEIDRPITAFGRGGSPDIVKRLKEGREPLTDARTIFGGIARSVADIGNPGVGAYIGPLSREVFDAVDALPDPTRSDLKIFTQFPGEPIRRIPVMLSNQPPKAMRKAITDAGMAIYSYADKMLDKLPNEMDLEGEYEAVTVSADQLGFPQGATFKAIKDRAQSLGLILAPAKLAAHLRVEFADQPDGYLIMGMEPIIVDGDAYVFELYSDGGRLELDARDGRDDFEWIGYNQFVFLRRK